MTDTHPDDWPRQPNQPALDDDTLTDHERGIVLAYVGAILDGHDKKADAFDRADGMTVMERADAFQNTAETVGEQYPHALALLRDAHDSVADTLLENGTDETERILRGLDAGTFWFEVGKKMRAIHHFVHEVQNAEWEIHDRDDDDGNSDLFRADPGP